MANYNTIFWIIGIILVVALLYQYGDFFGIDLTSSDVQYYNEPIEVQFKLVNYSNPSIKLFLDSIEILEFDANDSNQTVSFTKNIVNGTYDFYIEGIDKEGILKIVVFEGNITDTKIIKIEKPFIEISHNIPNTGDEGDSIKITAFTKTPQGEILDVDYVEIDIYYPDNSMDTIRLTKSGDGYIYNFNYQDKGTYQFKIRAIKEGFKTKEYSAVTTIISTGGIHPVIWLFIFAIILWLIFFGIKFARTR